MRRLHADSRARREVPWWIRGSHSTSLRQASPLRNGRKAVRCFGRDDGGRCGRWWKSRFPSAGSGQALAALGMEVREATAGEAERQRRGKQKGNGGEAERRRRGKRKSFGGKARVVSSGLRTRRRRVGLGAWRVRGGMGGSRVRGLGRGCGRGVRVPVRPPLRS